MASFEEIENYVCVICKELLLNPVRLPCNHIACLDCLEKTLDHNKYQCFLCRKFLGSWYRKVRRTNTLVNQELQDYLHTKFPDLMNKRLNGESLDILPTSCPVPSLCKPGEIKQDFDTEVAKWRNEIEKEREEESKLSEELIKQIEEEEYLQRIQEEKKVKEDERIARELAAELKEQQNDLKTQLNEDEALARKLVDDGYVTMLAPITSTLRVKKKQTCMLFKGENSNMKTDEDMQNNISAQLNLDEDLARKLASDDSPTLWKSKVQLRNDKLKKKLYGPMDRFLVTKRRH